MKDEPNTPKRRPVLSDHKRTGKTLVPVAATYGWGHVDFPQRIFPEIIWIGFVLESCGSKRGIELVGNFVEAAFKIASRKPTPEFAFLSAQRELTDDDWNQIRAALEKAGDLEELRRGLVSFVRCYPSANPLRKLWPKDGPGDFTAADVELARKLARPRLDRWSPEGTVLQAVVLYAEALTGRMSYADGMEPPNLEALFTAFESEAGQQAAGHARTHVTSSYAYYKERLGTAWADYFWRRGLELDPVPSHLKIPKDSKPTDHVLIRLRQDFERMATTALEALTAKLVALGLAEEVHAVVTGLLARQTSLAIGVFNTVTVWNWDVGPLYLRAMTDCYISLAWILIKPEERSQLYILHGLGQEKLQMAHYEELLKASTDGKADEQAKMMLQVSQMWVETQKFLFLVSVNLGSWAGKSVREMAEEAGCSDLYNYAYTPYTFSAHSTWNHVGKLNSLPSDSPLNRNLRMPVIPHYGAEPSIAINAAKYLDKALSVVLKTFKVEVTGPLPWEWTKRRMDEVLEYLFDRYDENERKDNR